MSYRNSDADDRSRTRRPSSEPELGRVGDAFKDRVEVLIRQYGSASELARTAGVSESVVRKWRAGKSDPSREMVAMLAAGTGANIVWLVTGEGPMRIEGEEGAPDGTRNGLVAIHRYEVEPDAGAGTDRLVVPRAWVDRELGVAPEHLVLVIARGDSMEPTIRGGAILLVDTRRQEGLDDGIYILRRQSRLVIKRVQHNFDGSITVKSDNPAYSEFTLPPDQAATLEVIGRVVWTGGKI